MKMHKIVLADDHAFLLEGISSILKGMPGVEIVSLAQNGFELMDAVAKERPDLVILDLNMPGYDGLQCLQKIKSGYPLVKVMVLTNYNQRELVEEVRKMQSDGYLIKNSTATELKDAIATILQGGSFYPDAHELQMVREDSYFFDDFLRKYQLTKREVEIIRLICQEYSTREIASRLFLSEFTVTTHRRNILRKLEVKNVAGLVNFAKQHQLL
jgi:DNA-binding NarL/FixJ family response regulator